MKNIDFPIIFEVFDFWLNMEFPILQVVYDRAKRLYNIVIYGKFSFSADVDRMSKQGQCNERIF